MGIGYTANIQATEAHALVPSPFDIQQDAWRVQSHHLEVLVDPGRHTIAGRSTLTMEPVLPVREQQVVLRFNPGLELTDAQDNSGRVFPTRRVGDSVVIELPAPPEKPLTLNVAWEGSLYIPYTAYGEEWWYDAPFLYAYDQPEPIRGLLMGKVGYLLRDGDWYPWPWTGGPHQAPGSRAAIRVTADEVLTLPARQDGAVIRDGILPPALLVLPPPRTFTAEGTTLYAGEMADGRLVNLLHSYASAARKLGNIIGEAPPQHIIAVPYLNDILWSGDLVLVPEGSSFYFAPSIDSLYNSYAATAPQTRIERTALAALARAWLYAYFPPPPMPFERVLPTPDGRDVRPAGLVYPEIQETQWNEWGGRWVQPVEIPDVQYTWNPGRNEHLTPSGEFSTVGFWIALELADPGEREADLDLLANMRPDDRGRIPTEQRVLSYERLWPYVLDAAEARTIVLKLHRWATVVGRENAVSLVVETLLESKPETVEQLFAEMELRSGVPIEEKSR